MKNREPRSFSITRACRQVAHNPASEVQASKSSDIQIMMGPMFMSDAVTRGVKVHVESEYAPERSQPAQNAWFFLYTITITNEGTETAQLLTRHWIITDGTGRVEEVRGPGVVGKQPVLAPGESFTYTSGCPLTTPFGVMEGTYQMVTAGGEQFEARIAPFTLSEPYTVH
jgi:ApaG protein